MHKLNCFKTGGEFGQTFEVPCVCTAKLFLIRRLKQNDFMRESTVPLLQFKLQTGVFRLATCRVSEDSHIG